jgi:ubiquinol-cytochrome c reductase cytochrome c subunit
MTFVQFVALLVTVSATVGTQAQAPAAQAAPAQTAQTAATVEAGKKLYTSYGCYQCHGYEAQGSSATGPRLGPRPLPYAAFSRYVRQPSGQMPLYTTTVLADADLERIYAYVQARPAARPIDSIPLLK